MNVLRALAVAVSGLIVSCVQVPQAPPVPPDAVLRQAAGSPAAQIEQAPPSLVPRELARAAPHFPAPISAPTPLTQGGKPVDWWFVFKFNAKSFPA
jgi:hypothetical protein